MRKGPDPHMSAELGQMDVGIQNTITVGYKGFVILIYYKNLPMVYSLPFSVNLCIFICGS